MVKVKATFLSLSFAPYLTGLKPPLFYVIKPPLYSETWERLPKFSNPASFLWFSFINRPFSKMAAENSNKLKLKTYTSTRKSTFTSVSLQSFSMSGVISAEKM